MKEYSKSLPLLHSLVARSTANRKHTGTPCFKDAETLEFSTNQRRWHDSSKL